jgi:hypothetical protein
MTRAGISTARQSDPSGRDDVREAFVHWLRNVDVSNYSLIHQAPKLPGWGVNLLSLSTSEFAIEQFDLTPFFGDQLIHDFAFTATVPEPSAWR